MSTEYQIDTEDAVISEVIINAEKGILAQKEGRLTLIWTTDNRTFHIIGELERDEIIKMAKSLKHLSK